MKIFSKRFNKEFEVETVKAGKTAVNPDEITVIRWASLNEILEDLGDTVHLNTSEIASYPIIGIKAEISDDTGVSAIGYASVNMKNAFGIMERHPVETLFTEAVSNAIIRYMKFPGRTYCDISIPAEGEEKETNAAFKPVKISSSTKNDEDFEAEVDNSVEEEEIPAETPVEKPAKENKPAKYVPPVKKPENKPVKQDEKPVEKQENSKGADEAGEFVVNIGSKFTRGKKVKELTEKEINWLVGITPTNQDGKNAQEAVKKYYGR